MNTEKIKRRLSDGGLNADRMVTVTDDWYPCYPGNQVYLYIRGSRCWSRTEMYAVRISAWGKDDTGVELEYTTRSAETAYALYWHWKKYLFDKVPDGVDKEWFYEHGFCPG